MLGTSALIVSIAFLIRSISPVHASNPNPASVSISNGYLEDGIIYFFDDGYIYRVKEGQMDRMFEDGYFSNKMAKWGKDESSVDLKPRWWSYRNIRKY